MLYTEFLTGTDQKDSEGVRHAYEAINRLYMQGRIDSKEDAYEFFKEFKQAFIEPTDVGVISLEKLKWLAKESLKIRDFTPIEIERGLTGGLFLRAGNGILF